MASSMIFDCIPASVYNVAMYSVKEAAKGLGLDTSQVRRLLAKGEIKGVKLARDWVVLDLSYKRKRRPKKRQ
jgi:excisionase family DNA binding protein